MSDMKIRVTTQELKSRADDVKEKTAHLKSAIEETERMINMTSSYWIGRAGDAKRKEFVRKKEMMRDMIGRLGEMAGIYESAEGDIAERTSALSSDVIM